MRDKYLFSKIRNAVYVRGHYEGDFPTTNQIWIPDHKIVNVKGFWLWRY